MSLKSLTCEVNEWKMVLGKNGVPLLTSKGWIRRMLIYVWSLSFVIMKGHIWETEYVCGICGLQIVLVELVDLVMQYLMSLYNKYSCKLLVFW